MRQDKISSSSFKKPHRHLLDADLRFRTLSYDCVLKRLVRFQKLSPNFWNFCRIKTLLPDFRTRQIKQILDVRFQRLSSYFTHLRRISDGFFRFWKALLLQKEIERMSKEKINKKKTSGKRWNKVKIAWLTKELLVLTGDHPLISKGSFQFRTPMFHFGRFSPISDLRGTTVHNSLRWLTCSLLLYFQ